MRRVSIVATLVVITALACFAQESSRGPSTRAERDRAIRITRELEANPLSPALRDDRDWLFHWIQAIPDITVNVCVDPAQQNSSYRYNRDLLLIKMFASTAYIIESSSRNRNDLSIEAAGVEGALKAYQSILRTHPQAHSRYWDSLLRKQANGTLRDYVAQYMEQACGSQQQQA